MISKLYPTFFITFDYIFELITKIRFHGVPRGCLQFVIVVFPDHTHLLFLVKVRLIDKNCLYSVKTIGWYSIRKFILNVYTYKKVITRGNNSCQNTTKNHDLRVKCITFILPF